MGKSRAVSLVSNIRECVWIIGCTNLVLSLMCILNYKNKLFDK